MVPVQDVFHKSLRNWRVLGRLVAAQDNEIDYREGGYQFGPRALGEQRLHGISHLDHQEPAGFARLFQAPNMLRQERIKVPRYPNRVRIWSKLLTRDDLRSGVQNKV